MLSLFGWSDGPGAASLHSTNPEPRAELDPVALALWRRGVPLHGLPLVLRGLAAWWRLPGGDELLGTYPRSVLAAAIDRMVPYRAGSPDGAKYDRAAAMYRVDSSAVRAVTPSCSGDSVCPTPSFGDSSRTSATPMLSWLRAQQ